MIFKRSQTVLEGCTNQARSQPEISFLGGRGVRTNYGGAKLFVYSDENEVIKSLTGTILVYL